jgi:hypothetical protein
MIPLVQLVDVAGMHILCTWQYACSIHTCNDIRIIGCSTVLLVGAAASIKRVCVLNQHSSALWYKLACAVDCGTTSSNLTVCTLLSALVLHAPTFC